MNIFLVLILSSLHLGALNPTGCTYEASTVLYTCSARLWSLPLNYNQFTVQPQRLLIKDVAGELPGTAPTGPTFAGFSAIITATFDKRFSPSLTIVCYANALLIITKAAFTDLGWVEEITIIDCDIASLPNGVFEHIGDVNSFVITGGSISNMFAESFKGLNVRKMPSAPTPKGEFIIRNSKITSGQLASGVLYSLNNASVVKLDNIFLTSISKTIFSGVKKLEKISLSTNNVSSLGNNLFAGLSSLSHVIIRNTNWHCTCETLWFIPYTKNNNISLDGDIVCSSPSTYTGQRAVSFYNTECAKYSPCSGKLGLVVGETCVDVWSIIHIIITFFSSVFTFVAFGTVTVMVCRERKEENKIQAVMKIRSVMADKIVHKLKVEIERMKTHIMEFKDEYADDDLRKSRIFRKEDFNEDFELKPCESDYSDENDENVEQEEKVYNIKVGMLDEIVKDDLSCQTDDTSIDLDDEKENRDVKRLNEDDDVDDHGDAVDESDEYDSDDWPNAYRTDSQNGNGYYDSYI